MMPTLSGGFFRRTLVMFSIVLAIALPLYVVAFLATGVPQFGADVWAGSPPKPQHAWGLPGVMAQVALGALVERGFVLLVVAAVASWLHRLKGGRHAAPYATILLALGAEIVAWWPLNASWLECSLFS